MTAVCVVILTYNEEKNILAALDSVSDWAKEIFIVDSFSTDQTETIVESYQRNTIRLVKHQFSDFSSQWNWALENLPIRSEWTLKLDADERATQQFKKEIDLLLTQHDDELEGVYFRRAIHFMGKHLKWGGVNDNYDLRLWRTGKARFERRSVNEHALVKGHTTRVKAMIRHQDYKGLTDWLRKHNRYSSMEAYEVSQGNLVGEVRPRLFGKPDERRMWLRQAYRKTPFRWLLYFIYKYVCQLGFLDGTVGFRYWFLRASYLYWIDLKLAELKEAPPLKDAPGDWH